MTLHSIVLWIHVVAASVWIGGIIFLGLIGPSMRAVDPDRKSPVFRIVARRFRDISWLAVVVLLVTGIVNLSFWGPLTSLPNLIHSNPMLLLKTSLVFLMILVKVVHDFIIGPAAARESQKSVMWKGAMFLGRLNLFLGLGVLYVAVLLRG